MSSEARSLWNALSGEFSAACEAVSGGVVAIDSGGRVAASGICWKDGVVVTASHLVRENGELTVLTGSGARLKGALAGRDPGRDLAVIHVEDGGSLKPVELADSGALRVGQWVLAVGRSGRGELAASLGIIARLGGEWSTWRGARLDQLIRPDVTLYPGQSGSALVTSGGKAAGMNTLALARSAAITVPADSVTRVAEELLVRGYLARPYLGVAAQPVDLPPELRAKLPEAAQGGLLVTHVEPDGPAAQAGVMLGDVLVRFSGRPVDDIERLHEELSRLRAGAEATLDLVRGGALASVKAKVGELPPRRR
ncbi:MAG TPA: trypsin-like peptidase domain-containing protein [Terriglobia bacterium]|nr:trypsin-like peptidase domain-containing protein [Terriglobia bacterium]